MPTPSQSWKRTQRNFFWPSISTILMLSLVNCGGDSNKEENNMPTGGIQEIPKEQTENSLADLQVIVKNTSGNLINQATVQLYDVTNQKVISVGISNELGIYNIKGIKRHSDHSIKIEHRDYTLQIAEANISLSSSDLNTLTITLLPIGEKVTFNEDTGGIVPLTTKSRGVKLTVPANAFIDEAGAAVEGLIEAEVTTIDMSSAQESAFFPGSFDAIDADGSNQHLYSYGVTHVDFYQNGKELKVAPNMKVAVEFPVFVNKKPNGEPVKAGDMIPLWWLDENTGIWIYETNAIVTASTDSPSGWVAKGSVSHFTAYNVDDRYPTIDVSVECFNNTSIGGGFEGASTGDIQTSVPCCISSKNVTPAFNLFDLTEHANNRYKFTVGGHGSICSSGHSVNTSPAQYPIVPFRIKGPTSITEAPNAGANDTLCQITAIKTVLDTDSEAQESWEPADLQSQIFHACYSQGIDFLTHTIKANYIFRKAEGENNWAMEHTYTVEPRPAPFVITSP